MKFDALVLTCEHARNRVPARYQHLFATTTAHAALHSHEGYDIGALPLARSLSKAFDTPLIHTDVTRLLVEPNRSTHHPKLFSAFSRSLGSAERQKVLDDYYHAHHEKIKTEIARHVRKHLTTLHVGVHTFTPRLNGELRRADIGLLYDPKKTRERRFAADWLAAIRRLAPSLRLRRNYPYLGSADGLTTTLRRHFPAGRYLGIELEVSQHLVSGPKTIQRDVASIISQSLRIAGFADSAL